ncbi:MAG: biotin carboxylase, partial [Leptospiraceae bacterium]|nr:biotin carboxylase [Leptospiraceae bacterium]
FGDRHGNIVHLFERECSIQRRHQKIIEESPSPALDDATRTIMADAAVKAARAVNYEGAGTVEFIYSDVDQSFFFLEMNTRLQVEHPVTELVTNRDLVAEQIRVARGERLSFAQHDLKQTGHAIEVRLYAEDPMRNFLPATGKIHKFAASTRPGVRVDAGITDGSEISIYYDPMIAKIIVHHPGDRSAAVDLMRQALHDTVLFGPANNLDFLRDVLAHKEFRAGRFTTHFIAEHFPTYRGAQVTPDLREIARLSAGLVFFHGGSRLHEEDRRKQERQAVAAGGGDLAPWFDLEGFELWSD